jgi:iron(III) transport system ATP-binding protein
MLRVRGLSKRFEVPGGQVGAVRELGLEVAAGEFFVLLGPSGCGKTTLLRCLAGLERPEAGEVVLNERVLSAAGQGLFVEPEDRDIAMVFQSYAIWPHMSVEQNVAFPLVEAKRRKYGQAEVAARVEQALERVQLRGFARHAAATLSGGQQQRVALARALVREPKLLLLDEPLSNLDARLREEMRAEIRELTRALGVTSIHVTHDQVEGMALADRMAVMRAGRILEVGRPEQLYRRPGTRVAAEFLGRTNWLEATVQDAQTLQSPLGPLHCPVPPALGPGTPVSLGIRPEWVELGERAGAGENRLAGEIESRMFLGEACLYRVRVGPARLLARGDVALPEDGPVPVRLPPERCFVFPAAEPESALLNAERGLEPAHELVAG